MGSVRHEFEVPPLDVFRTTTPVLTDTLQPHPAGPAQPPLPVPIARRTFQSGQTLHCAFEVLGASPDPQTRAPRVSAAWILKAASDGREVASEPPAAIPTASATLSKVFRLPLGDVAPGGYVMVVRVRDEVAGKTVEMRDPFNVTPAAR